MSDIQVIMPQLGESIFEGTLTKWLKREGDNIERDEPLFEISTDKVDSEIPSPASGVLKDIRVQEGETVEINTVVALIDDMGSVAESKPEDVGAVTAEAPAPQGVRPTDEKVEEGESRKREDRGIRSSPMVRRLAEEHGIDLEALQDKGTGAGGRITKNDILSYIEQQREQEIPPEQAARAPAGLEQAVERVPMTAMRKSIAEHMVASRRISAHVATVFEVDCSAILAARAAMKAEFDRAGVRLTVTPFFVKAAAGALKKFPILNSSVDGDAIVYKKAIHIGIAVAVEGGLIVPVVRNADQKNLVEVARTVADLGERARTKKLHPDEVQEGTFTVTNPGNFGGLFGVPIIHQPQVAILAIGGIGKRPIVVNDAIAIRPMVYLALSFDHRIIDGAAADQFMAEIKETLEKWSDK